MKKLSTKSKPNMNSIDSRIFYNASEKVIGKAKISMLEMQEMPTRIRTIMSKIDFH
jgi:hypothetical protein